MSEENKNTLFQILQKYKLNMISKSKDGLRTLTHLISGQNHLASNENKRDPTIVPTCRNCRNQKDNAQHLLSICPKYALHRQQFFGEAYPDIKEIIENIHPKIILKFVEATGKMDENYTFQLPP